MMRGPDSDAEARTTLGSTFVVGAMAEDSELAIALRRSLGDVVMGYCVFTTGGGVFSRVRMLVNTLHE